MDTTFMNSRSSKTSDPNRLVLLYMEKYKKSCKNNKLKLSTPTWNKEFELPDGAYSRLFIYLIFKIISSILSKNIKK